MVAYLELGPLYVDPSPIADGHRSAHRIRASRPTKMEGKTIEAGHKMRMMLALLKLIAATPPAHSGMR